MQLTNALFTYRTARYLRVPALSPGDILDFCSGIGDAEGNVTYEAFVHAIVGTDADEEDEEEKGEGGAEEATEEATDADALGDMPANAPKMDRIVSSTLVPPTGAEELSILREKRALAEAAEDEEDQAMEAAEEKRIEDELREEEAAEDQATGANPRLTSDAIEYDLTTGRPPRRLTSRGDYLYQDDLDPVYKTPIGTMHLQLLPRGLLFLPVPFSDSSDQRTILNSYTMRMEMMIPSLPPSGKYQALLQTSVHGEEDEAIIVVGSNGAVGSRMSGSHHQATVKGGKWHTVHITVCSSTLTVMTFVDGMLACNLQPDDMFRDGRYALQGGVCIGGSSRKDEELELRIRHVTVTSRALSAVEITDQNMAGQRDEQNNDDNDLFMMVLEALTQRYPDSDPDVSMVSFIVAEAQGSNISERFMSAMAMLG